MSITCSFPSVKLSHTPTAMETMEHFSQLLRGPELWIKRDDCTGLAMGGNKARQLEFYLGQALEKGADTLLTTGAVQSNHVRMTIAAARKLAMKVEVQLESRVSGRQPAYYESGNVLLMKLMGATIHEYPEGEDEEGADRALYDRAKELKQQGAIPYVIPLSGMHTPYGALGYVKAAEEMLHQMDQLEISCDAIVVASGSANTHAGLLTGLRLCGSPISVYGVCVRRNALLQQKRVREKAAQIEAMLNVGNKVTDSDVIVNDSMLYPGYGQINPQVSEAITLVAQNEGILLDPTYTGKAMAGLISLIWQKHFKVGQRVIFLHTGGTPALFGYPELLSG